MAEVFEDEQLFGAESPPVRWWDIPRRYRKWRNYQLLRKAIQNVWRGWDGR